MLRFVQDDFNENTSPTIGAAFLTQSESTPLSSLLLSDVECRLESRIVKFEIWYVARIDTRTSC